MPVTLDYSPRVKWKYLAATILAASANCGGDTGPVLLASPAHASQFGYVDVTLSGDLASLGDIQEVSVGGVPAYDLRATPTSLTVTVQGSPVAGPVEVEVDGSSGKSIHHGAFTYDPPAPGTPLVWAAFGASLTQGTQSMGIDEHTQTQGVTAQIARAAGVFLPMSILRPGIAPPLHATDFNLDCSQKPGTGVSANKLLKNITDPSTGFFDLTLAREAYKTVPQNYAIGGSKVIDTLTGGTGTVAVLEHIIEEPLTAPGDVVGQVDISQIDRLVQLDPDVAFCTDLLANDLDPAVTESDGLHPERITALSDVQPLLVQMMQRLGGLHGQYFIANMVSLTFVPNVVQLREKWIAAGKDPAVFDAQAAQIDQLTQMYNDALIQAMAPYPNLHLVDFAGRVTEVRMAGLRAGGELCTAGKFGGLLSFDNLHFSDTGYADYANLLVDQINATLGLAIPPVDVDAVHESDEAAPSVLRAAGFTCVPPPQ
jgi:hypothetical protein